jgi:hypothetical protein
MKNRIIVISIISVLGLQAHAIGPSTPDKWHFKDKCLFNDFRHALSDVKSALGSSRSSEKVIGMVEKFEKHQICPEDLAKLSADLMVSKENVQDALREFIFSKSGSNEDAIILSLDMKDTMTALIEKRSKDPLFDKLLNDKKLFRNDEKSRAIYLVLQNRYQGNVLGMCEYNMRDIAKTTAMKGIKDEVELEKAFRDALAVRTENTDEEAITAATENFLEMNRRFGSRLVKLFQESEENDAAGSDPEKEAPIYKPAPVETSTSVK